LNVGPDGSADGAHGDSAEGGVVDDSADDDSADDDSADDDSADDDSADDTADDSAGTTPSRPNNSDDGAPVGTDDAPGTEPRGAGDADDGAGPSDDDAPSATDDSPSTDDGPDHTDDGNDGAGGTPNASTPVSEPPPNIAPPSIPPPDIAPPSIPPPDIAPPSIPPPDIAPPSIPPPISRPPTRPPPPEGEECEEYMSAGSDYCSIDYSCPDAYYYSSCSQAGDKWQCDCSTEQGYASYVLGGTSGIAACEVMLAMCADDVEPEFTGPVECTEAEYGDDWYCEKSARCGSSADLGGGITAWEVDETVYSYCYDYDEGTIGCECQLNNGYRSLQLTGATLDNACARTFDVCAAEEELQFTGEEQCDAPYTSESNTSCGLSQQCGRSADLGEGISARMVSYRDTNCQSNGTNWGCTCNTEGASASFSIPQGSDTCAEAMDLCSKVGDVEPEGELTCEFYSRSSGPEYCSHTNACGMGAVVDGVELSVFGNVSVSCYEEFDGEYYCDCYSGSDTVAFDFPAAATPRDTCDAAIIDCQGMVDVQLDGNSGFFGGGIARPVPVDFF
jgi:hypothetical protein